MKELMDEYSFYLAPNTVEKEEKEEKCDFRHHILNNIFSKRISICARLMVRLNLNEQKEKALKVVVL